MYKKICGIILPRGSEDFDMFAMEIWFNKLVSMGVLLLVSFVPRSSISLVFHTREAPTIGE